MQRWRVDRLVPGERKRYISEDAIPWQVGLRRPDSVVKCGGVLLSEKVIISAAHCKDVLKFDGLDEAVLGSILTYQTIATEEPYWLSKKHFIHPRYQEFRAETVALAIYDLMLLFLSKSNFPQGPKIIIGKVIPSQAEPYCITMPARHNGMARA